MCYLYLRDYYLAEDATQETFIKAMKSYDSFLHNSNEKTWLIRIAINSCKNIMRTKWFRIPLINIEQQHNIAVHDSTEDLIEKENISKAIMSLSKSDREIIILYYYQELTVREISYITQKKENAINQQLRRAREKLKNLLKEDSHGR